LFRKTVSAIMLSLLVISTLTLAFRIQIVKADDGTIYINADGSITPSTAPIYSADNITYTLTGNITANSDGIAIERDGTVLDGAGFTIQGDGTGNGINLSNTKNVTIENTNIQNLDCGIYLENSSGNVITGNNVTANNYVGIWLNDSSNNIVNANNATADSLAGIYIIFGNGNIVSGNIATSNEGGGFSIIASSNDTVSGNIATANGFGIFLYFSSNSIVNGNDATANILDGICLEGPGTNEPFPPEINSSSNIVSGNNATGNGADGIDLVGCSSNIVSANNATGNGGDGIDLLSSTDNAICGNNATANGNGIYLQYSSNDNAINDNQVAANYWDGIYLISSSNNTIIGNNVTANKGGISLQNSSHNTIYHNDFVENTVQASFVLTCVGNAWDDGYPSGGNYWSDYNGTDLYHGTYQNETGSDGLGDTPYPINANAGVLDNYPLMRPFSTSSAPTGYLVAAITTNCTWVYQGQTVIINVTVSNFGDSPEDMWVTLYTNVTAGKSIGAYPVYVNAGQSYTLPFTWNIENVPCCTYMLTAVATISTGSNTLSDGNISVRLLGDVNGDGRVDLRDLALVARAFGSTPGSPNWNPACDFYGDGTVNMKDIALVARNFGQHYP
jgi:parallel beta-helix repeat protein